MGLMAALAAWLKQIIAVVLLASLVDLLLPNRTMQRYVRLVAGLFILLTVATPLLQWLHGDFGSKLAAGLNAIGNVPESAAGELSRIEAEGRNLRERRQEETATLMAVRLQDAIRADLAESGNPPVKQVLVNVERLADGALSVKDVIVRLGRKETDASAADGGSSREAAPVADMEPVAPVVVDISPSGRRHTEAAGAETADRRTEQRIAGWIAARYGIPAERVQVVQAGPHDD